MLKIRAAQLEEMNRQAMRQFIQRVTEHLKKFFPEECQRAGEERMLGAIRQGMYRASKYGIVMERHVVIYITLSVALGLDFDSGRRYPWVVEILNDPRRSAAMKIAGLVRKAKDQLNLESTKID